MNNFYKIYCFILLTTISIFAQFDDFPDEGLFLPTPDINTSLGIGFNYDYLKSPLDVDFENAKGYYAVNIPIKFALSDEMIDSYFSNLAENFTDGEYFRPNIAARQFANSTIRVDVPMLWGVCSFSHMNVMTMNYQNSTGMPSFRYTPKIDAGDGVDADLLLLGNLNTPINFSLGWETMMFGYVYKINDIFTVGINLNRHRFYFRANANIDIDISGKVNANMNETNVEIPIDYSLRSPLSGDYSLERWTPTLAARIWRFDIFSRIMFKDYATGSLSGKYSVPFFIDPSTFQIKGDLQNKDYLLDNIKNGNFMQNKADTISLYTNKKMKWELPSVLTLKYHIIPEHLSISYSKFFGKTSLELIDSALGRRPDGTTLDYLQDGLDLRVGVDLDHLILLNGNVGWFYGSMGIMAFNVDWQNRKNILSGVTNQDFLVKYGKGVMLPTLSGGGIIGTKLQVMLELNILPLTALKTGLVYNF